MLTCMVRAEEERIKKNVLQVLGKEWEEEKREEREIKENEQGGRLIERFTRK